MLKLILFFCLLHVMAYSQEANTLLLSRKMGHQGLIALDHQGKEKFRLEEGEVYNAKKDLNSQAACCPEIPSFNFDEGYLPVKMKDGFSLLDIDGNIVATLEDRYKEIFTPSGGYMLAELLDAKRNKKSKNKYLFLNKNGKRAFKNQVYHSATAFTDEISVVQFYRKGPWEIIEKTGKVRSRLQNHYRKFIQKIHSTNNGRIIATVSKPRLFNKRKVDHMVLVFNYDGRVVFRVGYHKYKDGPLEITNKYGVIIIKSRRSTDFYDRNGKLLHSFSGWLSLKNITKDYYFVRDKRYIGRLYDKTFKPVELPALSDSNKVFIQEITDHGITGLIYSVKNNKPYEVLIFEPVTFNTLYKDQLEYDANQTFLHYPLGSITNYSVDWSVQSMHELNGKLLYNVDVKDSVFDSLKEALKQPENVYYLTLYNSSDLIGIEQLTNLRALTISDPKFEELPDFSALKNLSYLNLSGCSKITKLPPGIKETKLKYLEVLRCDQLKLKTIIPDLKHLKEVYLSSYIQIDQSYRDILKLLKVDVEFKTNYTPTQTNKQIELK